MAKKKSTIDRKIKREISFKLTTKDRAEFGDQLGKLNGIFGDIDREFDKVKKEFKGRLEAIELEVDQIAKWLRDGEQRRIVDVIERKDFDTRKVFYLFENKSVEDREMTHEESQTEMPLFSEQQEPVKIKKAKKTSEREIVV